MSWISLRGALLLGLALAARVQGGDAGPRKIEFNRHVRPILSDKCYACHGPDKNRRKADLRLDVKESAYLERKGRAAIVPGQPEKSELIRRITSRDPEERMPPPDSGKMLSAEEIELLRKWIQDGAEWQAHWSYLKLARPELPPVEHPEVIGNPLDRFVLWKLERAGLSFSPEADRVTLARRLSFDLTGLPPSPEETARFQADPRPEAYRELAERLVASPHYGERMALFWLDLVRYADTTGIHGDNHRNVSPYRDYVIKAFNDNKRFDRFTVEQLAGDLLPEATLEQKVASGYNRLLMTTNEGGAQPREYIAKYAADRVRNASVVWMGATMGCAECHDHKFDPYTTRDFYRFAAFFADQKEKVPSEPGLPFPVPSSAQAARLQELEAQIAAVKKEMETPTAEILAAEKGWEERMRALLSAAQASWVPWRPEEALSSGGATLTVEDGLSILAGGKDPDQDTYTLSGSTGERPLAALRLEALTHPDFKDQGPSRSSGNFVLTEVEVEVRSPGAGGPEAVKIESSWADHSQEGFPVKNAADGDPRTGWAVGGGDKSQSRTAVFVFRSPIAGGPERRLTVRLKQESGHPRHTLGRFRLSWSPLEKEALQTLVSEPPAVVRALSLDAAGLKEEEKAALDRRYREVSPLLEPARKRLAELKKRKEELDGAIPRTLVSMAADPQVVRVLPRGNWLDESGEIVLPGVPAFLGQLETQDRRATRLDLARWLVAPDNPLTARVLVNRLWKLFFGAGLSRTPDDLGSQGGWPTHPELLDWLAVELIESGWDVKHVVKLMVLSTAYRQTSSPGRELREKDPYNELLARQTPFRLDAEVVRDNALAVSGLLVRTVGGASVRPYQPPGYWSHLNFPIREYQPDHGESLYRRGLYTYWCRTFLHPSLLAFDAPTREECTVSRPRSNTPLQALVLLNDPTYVEAARVFAERILKQGGTGFEERLDWAYRRATSRAARPEERELLGELYREHLREYSADRQAAEKLLGAGEWPRARELDPAEHAAWTSLARVILNLHETITRS